MNVAVQLSIMGLSRVCVEEGTCQFAKKECFITRSSFRSLAST